MMPSTFLPPRPLCSNCLARFYYGSLAAGKAPKTNSKNRPLKKDDLEEAGAAPSTKCFVLPPKTNSSTNALSASRQYKPKTDVTEVDEIRGHIKKRFYNPRDRQFGTLGRGAPPTERLIPGFASLWTEGERVMRAESEWEEQELGKLEDEFAVGRVPQITAPLPFTCPGLKKAARIKRLRAERREQLKMAKENPEINRASLPGIPPPKPKSIRGEKRRKSTEHLPKPEQQQSI